MATASDLPSTDIFIAIPFSVCFIQPTNMRITIFLGPRHDVSFGGFLPGSRYRTMAKMQANVYYLRQPVIGGADRSDVASSCTTVSPADTPWHPPTAQTGSPPP